MPTIDDGEDVGSITQKRRKILNRVGSKARVVLKKDLHRRYVVSSFEDRHNHCLRSELSRQFLKVNRKLEICYHLSDIHD